MKFDRPGRLLALFVCACSLSSVARAQEAAAPQQKQQPSPFESVPQATEPAKPSTQKQQPSPFESVPEAKEPAEPTP
ncbi:MAG TPA: hypothetical protein PLP04_16485, partial [Bryobacteraceae bacterium]|nr:hypothetical protein [Bryobacteraceae bacterium]